MPRGLKLFLAIAAVLPACAFAQVDRYGRDLSDERQLAPLEPADAIDTESLRPAPGADFTLLPYVVHDVGSRPDAVAIGDVTNDRRADVVMTTTWYADPASDYSVFVFPQNAFDGSLERPAQVAYGQTPARTGLALGDFDGLGGLDVAIGGGTGVSVLTATAGAPWLSLEGIVATQEAQPVGALDLNRDGTTDLVSVSWSTGGYTYTNDGAAHFSPQRWSVPVAGFNSLATGDLDGDAFADVAVASAQGPLPNLTLNRSNGDGTLTQFGALSAECNGMRAWGVGIGDVDGDTINDVVATAGGNGATACLLVFHGKGGGRYAPPQRLASYEVPETIAVADMNNDGRKDVVVLHGGWLRVGVYLQQRDGTLGAERLFPIPYASHYSPQGLAVGDFTGDGCPDVAIGDYNYGLVTLTNGMRCPRRL